MVPDTYSLRQFLKGLPVFFFGEGSSDVVPKTLAKSRQRFAIDLSVFVYFIVRRGSAHVLKK